MTQSAMIAGSTIHGKRCGARSLARMVMPDNRPVTVRNYAKRDFAPERQLRITVSEPIPIGTGSTARLRRFRTAPLSAPNCRSTDNGNTWTPCPNLQGSAGGSWESSTPADPSTWSEEQDPATLVMATNCREIRPGLYSGRLCRSLDGWQSRRFWMSPYTWKTARTWWTRETRDRPWQHQGPQHRRTTRRHPRRADVRQLEAGRRMVRLSNVRRLFEVSPAMAQAVQVPLLAAAERRWRAQLALL